MSVPADVKKDICCRLWAQADTLDWVHLSIPQKTQQYEIWAKDTSIGIQLSHYMTLDRVHPYIKDSLMKPYAKQKKLSTDNIFKLLVVDSEFVVEDYIKPHGVRLDDGRIVCWGRAVDWKIILLSLFERSQIRPDFVPFAAVLSDSSGKFNSMYFNNIIGPASKLLGIQRIVFS